MKHNNLLKELYHIVVQFYKKNILIVPNANNEMGVCAIVVNFWVYNLQLLRDKAGIVVLRSQEIISLR